jgi:hypothetical protein
MIGKTTTRLLSHYIENGKLPTLNNYGELMANLIANRWVDESTGIVIESTKIGLGTVLEFAIRKDGMVLNKQTEWEYEPIPSNRDESFLSRCRWDDFNEAHKALSQAPDIF